MPGATRWIAQRAPRQLALHRTPRGRWPHPPSRGEPRRNLRANAQKPVRAPDVHREHFMDAKLAGPIDLAGFRSEARQLLAHQVPPHEVHWAMNLEAANG